MFTVFVHHSLRLWFNFHNSNRSATPGVKILSSKQLCRHCMYTNNKYIIDWRKILSKPSEHTIIRIPDYKPYIIMYSTFYNIIYYNLLSHSCGIVKIRNKRAYLLCTIVSVENEWLILDFELSRPWKEQTD